MEKNRKEPLYQISVVARMLGVHPQTLRLYEREGLVKPTRTEGNVRLYSEEDVEKLRTIISLTRDLGVNLAGVEIILRMREQIEELQRQVEKLTELLKNYVQVEVVRSNEPGLVKIPVARLVKVEIVEGKKDDST
ncbi:MAG: heat shock protein transcriptional repressor HspR [Thermosulfidibacteraceae bacterium]|jgi:MerR family transcriptional regulator/heat shock protein HspR